MPGTVIHTFKPSTQADLCEFQPSQGYYTEKPCLKEKKCNSFLVSSFKVWVVIGNIPPTNSNRASRRILEDRSENSKEIFQLQLREVLKGFL